MKRKTPKRKRKKNEAQRQMQKNINDFLFSIVIFVVVVSIKPAKHDLLSQILCLEKYFIRNNYIFTMNFVFSTSFRFLFCVLRFCYGNTQFSLSLSIYLFLSGILQRFHSQMSECNAFLILDELKSILSAM